MGSSPSASSAVSADGAPRVGFIVSRAVGNAVTRNRVKRRLRAQMSNRLDQLGAGWAVVVRALPPSARSSSAALAADLESALCSVVRREPGSRRGERR